MCGTCGGSKTDLIGEAHWVDEAIKFDRGRIEEDSSTSTFAFTISPDKFLKSRANLERHGTESTRVSLCSNHIFELDPNNFPEKVLSNYREETVKKQKELENLRHELISNSVTGIDRDVRSTLVTLLEKHLEDRDRYFNRAQHLLSKQHKYLTDMETFEFFEVCKLSKVPYFGCLRIVSDKPGHALHPLTKRNIRKGLCMGDMYDKLMMYGLHVATGLPILEHENSEVFKFYEVNEAEDMKKLQKFKIYGKDHLCPVYQNYLFPNDN